MSPLFALIDSSCSCPHGPKYLHNRRPSSHNLCLQISHTHHSSHLQNILAPSSIYPKSILTAKMPGKNDMTKSDSSRIQSSQATNGRDMSSNGFASRAQSAGDRNANANPGSSAGGGGKSGGGGQHSGGNTGSGSGRGSGKN